MKGKKADWTAKPLWRFHPAPLDEWGDPLPVSEYCASCGRTNVPLRPLTERIPRSFCRDRADCAEHITPEVLALLRPLNEGPEHP